ncbi:UDP-N-acetylmuramate--alanine ligase [Thermosipho melanesiensis]|uniref:UDP-N-acetylmuramate--L-alanine ligase n=2 Tax=Thermosipho melanesiensis TaxID=46541 RepID=A6LLF0_THEM4|nr:UDP-N-acetylmuramate--L-alanine ligase [Thermosipho melanesiensis]ABR30751.1 UDP-N-acetylmuramate--alanine ligase [Thermosipho melanesiensis BI429]APT73874.1 UDP-N-acetylmuramate--alanine ligase [Thermosipho melanesiensis]OOC35815.1 UDP-N-acetylmuramate--alanine ligase [Thermosipho melanesiensis]OOC38317.1 UDP-N-acetylmuramate--alanine ligase [Thermosipho melanesiensis]OOC38778.1 UDP-N-acetylmuramate--alanine ligase [Thermosipho melanesiensis]
MKIHFLGIGGIGMSAQAIHEHLLGNKVSGTDPFSTERTKFLENLGIKIFSKHAPENIDNVDLIVRTPAVPETNPEILKAREKNIKIISRLEHHINILKPYKKIGITGTDGKTTTTSMMSHVLLKLEENPTVFLGSTHPMLEYRNYRKGGNISVFEMDESQPGFENYNADFLIITNIRYDHIENFESLQHYNYCFEKSCKNAKICISNSENNIEKNSITFGLKNADYKILSIEKMGYKQKVKILTPYGIKNFLLNVPGIHNVLNALSVIALCFELGYEKSAVLKAFEDFVLPGRRFQIYRNEEITIIDDYSHTPIEIKSLLLTAKEVFKNKKIQIIFQPHRFTRLKREWKEFAKALSIADKVYITEVYGAFEKVGKISAKIIADEINATFLSNIEDILDIEIEPDNVYIFAGAGDIINFSQKFKEKVGGLKI